MYCIPRPRPAPAEEKDCYSAARRKVSTTGRRNTSRRPHHPAPSASTAPASAPASGTTGEAVQLNSNT